MKAPVRKNAVLLLAVCSFLTFIRATSVFAGGDYLAYDLGYGSAYDINSSRTIAGDTSSDGRQRAFSFSAGVMTDLGALPGMDSSIAYAVNELDNVVGVSFSSDGSGGFPQGFRFKIDTMAEIGTLGLATYAYDINDSGVIVGESVLNEPDFPTRAFAAFGGTLADLGTLGGLSSAASGINNSGTIVGWAQTIAGSRHAFSYHAGVMTDLGVLEAGGSSQASDVNDSGVTVGWASVGKQSRGFVHSDGVMTPLPTLGGGHSFAHAINAEGVIVGSASARNGKMHPFVIKNGRMTDLAPYLAPLGLTGSSEALGVNELGDIVGSGEDKAGRPHAFLLLFLPDHRMRRCRHAPLSGLCSACRPNGRGVNNRQEQSVPVAQLLPRD